MGRRQKVPLPSTGKYRLFNLPVVDFSQPPPAATNKRGSVAVVDDEPEYVPSDGTSSGTSHDSDVLISSDSDVKIVSPNKRSKGSGNSSKSSGSAGSGKASSDARKRRHANQKYDGPALRFHALVVDSDGSDGCDTPVKVKIDLLPAFVEWDKATCSGSGSKRNKPGNRLIRSEWFTAHGTVACFVNICISID